MIVWPPKAVINTNWRKYTFKTAIIAFVKSKAFLQSYMKFGHKLRHNEFVQSRVLILEPWIKDFAMLFFIYISKNRPYCFVIERHSLIGHIIRKG